MSTVRVGSICFRLLPDDHAPRHAHGEYSNVEVIVNLRADGTAVLANRTDRVQPRDAKRRDVRRILMAAQEHFDELVAAWEEMHP